MSLQSAVSQPCIPGVSQRFVDMLVDALRKAEVPGAILYGSRAKGTHRPGSDVDIALEGIRDFKHYLLVSRLVDELEYPYLIDLTDLATLRNEDLRQHIERVGMRLC